MSYTYLQEQEAESSAANFSAIPAYVLLNLNLTAAACCYNASVTDACPSSQSGTMCGHSTGDRGEDSSMLCAADSHAKTFRRLDAAKASRASVQDSGEKWPASLARFDHDTCSWRTHQFSLRGDLELFSATWPRWGLMRDGECWERTMPVPPTFGSGSGSWPTPNTIGYRSDGEMRILAAAGLSESEFRAMTHRAAESKRRPWLPAPRKSDSERGGRGDLIQAVRGHPNSHYTTFPTPTVQDAANNGGPSQANRNTPPLNSVVGGALNPPWVEWLMGWPIGWTDLQPLETGKYQQWLHSHGGR